MMAIDCNPILLAACGTLGTKFWGLFSYDQRASRWVSGEATCLNLIL